MSFIRPEIAVRLNRWRETLAGAGAAAFGSYLMVRETGALLIIGTVLTVGGALLIFHLLEINHRLPAGPLQRIC